MRAFVNFLSPCCCNGISQQARRGAACPPPSSPTRTPSLRGPVRAAAHLAHACGAAPREAHAGRFRPRAAGASAAPSARLPCGVLRVRMGAGASVPDELKAELAAAAQAAAQGAGGAEGAGEGAPAHDTPEQAAAQRALERALARAAEKALSSLPAAPSGALVEALAALEVRRNVGEGRGTNWPLRDLASTPRGSRAGARCALVRSVHAGHTAVTLWTRLDARRSLHERPLRCHTCEELRLTRAGSLVRPCTSPQAARAPSATFGTLAALAGNAAARPKESKLRRANAQPGAFRASAGLGKKVSQQATAFTAAAAACHCKARRARGGRNGCCGYV